MRKYVGYRQLCAIASALASTDRTLVHDSVEWKESIKDRVVQLGYQRPRSADVGRAMDREERWRPWRPPSRPAPDPRPVERPDPTIAPRRWRKASEYGGFTHVADLPSTWKQR